MGCLVLLGVQYGAGERVLVVSAEGVEVFANVTLTSVESDKDNVKVTTSSGIEVCQ